jgi:hypothetical protein
MRAGKSIRKKASVLVVVFIVGLAVFTYGFSLNERYSDFLRRAHATEGVVTELHYDLRTPYARVRTVGGRTVDMTQFVSPDHKPQIGDQVRVLVTPTDSYTIEYGSRRSFPVMAMVAGLGMASVAAAGVAFARWRSSRSPSSLP